MNKSIPANTPHFGGNEIKYLTECIELGWISSEGSFVSQLEDKFAATVDRTYGIAVANGSAALDVAIAALGLKRGDEVIVPTFTIISPVLSIIRSGAKPILVDSNLDTFNIDVALVEAKITAKTKAIIAIHLYGLPVDLDPLLDLCERHQLILIEDASQMLGQTYKGNKCGSFGLISTFSFYPNKLITTGEGGMIVCSDKQLVERCRSFRNLCFQPELPRFVHQEMGWNYRMSNLQAAVGLAQLEQITEHKAHQLAVGNRYAKGLENLQNFQVPLKQVEFATNNYWVFGLVARTELLKERSVSFLAENGIATRPFFWCMHEQPVFRKLGLFENEQYPVAEKMARQGFYLPGGTGISMESVDKVIEKMLEFDKNTTGE